MVTLVPVAVSISSHISRNAVFLFCYSDRKWTQLFDNHDLLNARDIANDIIDRESFERIVNQLRQICMNDIASFKSKVDQ